MFLAFPGPAASLPTQALDDVSPRRPLRGGIVLNERGEEVTHWPDDRPLPDRWSISRRLVAMDADVTFAPSTGMDVESAFECLPRGLQRRRHQIEVDLAYSTDPFERAQAMRLTEVLCRELQNLGDLAAAGMFLGTLARLMRRPCRQRASRRETIWRATATAPGG